MHQRLDPLTIDVGLRITGALAEKLALAAQRRRILAPDLVVQAVQTMINDDLWTAVLDE